MHHSTPFNGVTLGNLDNCRSGVGIKTVEDKSSLIQAQGRRHVCNGDAVSVVLLMMYRLWWTSCPIPKPNRAARAELARRERKE
jgi:hypothetical protein